MSIEIKKTTTSESEIKKRSSIQSDLFVDTPIIDKIESLSKMHDLALTQDDTVALVKIYKILQQNNNPLQTACDEIFKYIVVNLKGFDSVNCETSKADIIHLSGKILSLLLAQRERVSEEDAQENAKMYNSKIKIDTSESDSIIKKYEEGIKEHRSWIQTAP